MVRVVTQKPTLSSREHRAVDLLEKCFSGESLPFDGLVFLVIGGELLSTDGTRVVEPKPSCNALDVKLMATVEDYRLIDDKSLETNTTFV